MGGGGGGLGTSKNVWGPPPPLSTPTPSPPLLSFFPPSLFLCGEGSWSLKKGLGDPSPILTPKSFSCETPTPF